VSATQPVQRISELLIRTCCRRLPDNERAERCKEWSAELPAILEDKSIPPILRAVRALQFSAGISRTTRRLSPAGGGVRRRQASGWRDGALPVQPMAPAVRLTIGGILWLVCLFTVVALARAFPQSPVWILLGVLGLAAAFDAFCLADIAHADEVRYLPKWGWALVCLAQFPAGGIIYLCVGRVGRAQPAPPSAANRP
jgi:hypothetical protein